MDKTIFKNKNEWLERACQIGLVLYRDSNFLILEDTELGICIGEFDLDQNVGWIYNILLSWRL